MPQQIVSTTASRAVRRESPAPVPVTAPARGESEDAVFDRLHRRTVEVIDAEWAAFLAND